MTFSKGDVVEWTSQAAGISKTKRGIIVAVMPAGVWPGWYLNDFAPKSKRWNTSKHCNFGDARKRESYIVRVGDRIYWPHVKQLRKVEDNASV